MTFVPQNITNKIKSWVGRSPLARRAHIQDSLDEVHQYWKNPSKENIPQTYLSGEARSKFLSELVRKHVTFDAKIMEVGCNTGRNLNYLYLSGFKNLSAIEINKDAIESLKQTYPELGKNLKIHNVPVEQIITQITDSQFDVIYTMAVLEHIHTDSEWVFGEIVRVTKNYLITIEDERAVSRRKFPRNYKKIFEAFGMKQIFEKDCGDPEGLEPSYTARIFMKQ